MDLSIYSTVTCVPVLLAVVVAVGKKLEDALTVSFVSTEGEPLITEVVPVTELELKPEIDEIFCFCRLLRTQPEQTALRM